MRSMSVSEEAETESPVSLVPSDEILEKALRNTVARIYKTGHVKELTVKRVRLATEQALELAVGFFKGDTRWRAKSDEIIKDEVEVQDNLSHPNKTLEQTSVHDAPQPVAMGMEVEGRKTKLVQRSQSEASLTASKSRKTDTARDSEVSFDSKEFTEPPSDENEDDDELAEMPTKSREQPSLQKKASFNSLKRFSPIPNVEGEHNDMNDGGADSESELSEVLDEAPGPPRKRQKSGASSSRKSQKKAESKGKEADLDPDQAEIKRLQGWLVKCGIRKMWFRELAPYDTPKAKIRHLKNMLRDVGMDGRYSLDKAKRIREERELKADLELVQEGAKRWGTGDEPETGDSKPRRRLNRGLKSLAFLENDGEETD